MSTELKPGLPARLTSQSFDVNVGGHPVTFSLAGLPGQPPIELLISARGESGKSDTGLQMIFAGLGIAVSRALQGRNPETGEAL
jgi:hypothetical protein